ncbi:MAG: DUF2520 domain-containing protein [Prolixibacteraceae bacterium]|nr:DUF2520 domain-containing protein [Prolixibacteraceae bacterium]
MQKIVFIGAGNLATRLSKALFEKGHEIVQIYSRTEESASMLAKSLACNYTTKTEEISKNADIYIISVSDGAYEDVLGSIDFNNKLIVHTSGSLSIEILKNYSENYGVLYPLQTFSKAREPDFTVIPFCIEANTIRNEEFLHEFAKTVTTDIRNINSEQRKKLHLAAVFASNFTNHMYYLAERIIEKENLPFDILIPLIEEVAEKVKHLNPAEAQTGPAKRKDLNIIAEHLKMLKDDEDISRIYKILTFNIVYSDKKNEPDKTL